MKFVAAATCSLASKPLFLTVKYVPYVMYVVCCASHRDADNRQISRYFVTRRPQINMPAIDSDFVTTACFECDSIIISMDGLCNCLATGNVCVPPNRLPRFLLFSLTTGLSPVLVNSCCVINKVIGNPVAVELVKEYTVEMSCKPSCSL